MEISNPNIKIRELYLLQQRSDKYTEIFGYANLLGVVENISSEIQCYVQLVDVRLHDKAGIELDSDDRIYANGTMGSRTSAFHIDSCLAPDELVYLYSIQAFSGVFDKQIADMGSVMIGSIESVESDSFNKYKLLDSEVKPISYRLTSSEQTNEFTVIVSNLTPKPICIDTYTTVFIDDSGLPVGVEFDSLAGSQKDNTFTLPGDELEIEVNLAIDTVPFSMMRPVINFDFANDDQC